MLRKILKNLVYITIFFLPIFWLPFSFEFLEFNKLYLLFFLSWTGVLIWFLKEILADKEIRFRWSWFDLLVFIFVLIAIFSFAFSADKISGIFGTYGRFHNGLLALLAGFGLYLLIRNNLKLEIEGKESGEITFRGIFNSLLFSTFLVVLWVYFSLSGIWLKIPSLQQIAIFNPASSSAYSLAVFLSLIVALVLLRLLVKKELKKIAKIFYTLFLVLSFPLLLIFDFLPAWILLLLTLIFFISISIWQGIFKEDVHKLIFPIFLIIISLLFSFLNLENLLAGFSERPLGVFNYPREQILDQPESWEIGFKTVTASLKNGFLGSGIGSFLSDFSQFKSDRMNKNLLWQFRFDRAGNHFAEILATSGFLGGIVFFLILAWLLILAIWKKTDLEGVSWKGFLIGLIVLQFVFYQNMILAGIFWLGLTIGANLGLTKEKRFPIKDYPEITLIFETLVIVLALLLVAGYFFGIKFYLADYYYQKGFLEPDLDKKIVFFQKSFNLNPYQPYYQMAFSQVLIPRLQQELGKAQEKQDQKLIENLANSTLALAKRVTLLAPGQILFQENLANVYRDLGQDEWAIQTYQTALKLEPKNPLFYIEIGKIQAKLTKFEEARMNFKKALDLVPQLAIAKMQLGLLLDQERKTKEAISEFENLAREYPFNAEICFHLGRLYYNNDETEKAIEQFQRAVQLFPNYSNAHFSLALSFERKGEFQKALEELKIVEDLNPENEIVKKKIEEIKKKLEQPVPEQPAEQE